MSPGSMMRSAFLPEARLWVFSWSGRHMPRRTQIREQGAWILFPLVALAVLSFVGGVFGLPDLYGEAMFGIQESNSLHYFLEPVAHSAEHHVSPATEMALAGTAVLAAIVATALAALLYYYRTELPSRIGASLAPLYRLVWNKYYVDELYDRTIVRPLVALSDRVLYRVVDARLIDGVGVDGTAATVKGLAERALRYLQSGLMQSYVFVMIIGGVALIGYMLGAF